MKIDEIKKAYVEGRAVPPAMAGEAIAKDAEMFFAYLADHNPAQVNKTLRLKLGYDFLPVVPDRAKIGGAITSMLAKDDWSGLQQIINDVAAAGFNKDANNYTTDPEIHRHIVQNFHSF